MLEPYIGRQIERRTFPGVSLLVAGRGRVLYERGFGCRASWPEAEPLDADTLFDLASLTKPLVTAFLAACLLERRQWRLEDEARRFLAVLPRGITLEHLLTHTSGFRPWHPFYLYRPEGDAEQAARLAPLAPPGARVAYSDIGFILLKHLVEKAAGGSFQDLAAELIFRPLGLRRTFLAVPAGLKASCAPTEVGNRWEKGMCRGEHAAAAARFAWRAGLIRGEVHDANSFHGGGCAGNAGLFSSARDLFRLSREFFPAAATLLKAETVSLFWRNRTAGDPQARSLGFQLNASAGASGGRALSPGAIGHTGFTGTSLWLEAEGERQWIILSNRVHPRVRKENFNVVRRRLHRLLRTELGWG